MPILLKSLSMALLEYPVVNSEATERRSSPEDKESKVGVLLKGICTYARERERDSISYDDLAL